MKRLLRATNLLHSFEPSHLGVIRLLSMSVAFAQLCVAALQLPQIVSQGAPFDRGAYGVLVLVFFVPPIVSGVVSLYGGVLAIRCVNGAVVLLQFGVLAAWLPMSRGNTLPAGSNAPWVVTTIALSAVSAAIAWRPRYAWGYLLIASTALALVRAGASDGVSVGLAAVNGAQAFVFGSVLTAITITVRQVSENITTRAAEANTVAATEAEGAARAREKTRAHALMHDGILSTLLVASKNDDGLRAAVARQADAALADLRSMNWAEVEHVDTSSEEVVAALEAIVYRLSPETRFRAVAVAGATVPWEVGQRVSEAMAEALKNSLRHAASATERTVDVSFDADGLRVCVSDNGPGFARDLVPTARMGVSVSIVGRMNSLVGGRAHIDSAPNRGCVVALAWSGA